jgi:hypothetical protein
MILLIIANLLNFWSSFVDIVRYILLTMKIVDFKQVFKDWMRKAFQLWFNIGIGLEVEKIFVFVF